MRYTHTITGEDVIVTARINGVTIFDTGDDTTEELLDSVFDAMYEPASE